MRPPAAADTPRRRARRTSRRALFFLSLLAAVGVLCWYAWIGVYGCLNFEDETVPATVFVAGIAAQLAAVVRARGRPHWSWSIALAAWVLSGGVALVAGFEAMEHRFPLERPRVGGWNVVLDGGEPNLVLVPWLHFLLWLGPVLWLARAPRPGPPQPRP